MSTTNDFVEDWIQIRGILQKQVKSLEAGQSRTGTDALGDTTDATLHRLRKWIDEVNALLKEHASAHA